MVGYLSPLYQYNVSCCLQPEKQLNMLFNFTFLADVVSTTRQQIFFLSCSLRDLNRLLYVLVILPVCVCLHQKHCDRQKANLRIRFKPSLFQHVGTHSSLAGKIQKLKVMNECVCLCVSSCAEAVYTCKLQQGNDISRR